jgi:sugar phosphate isomerase/epimerase
MERVLSTHLFVQQHLTTSILEHIRDAGFAQVELYGARQHLDYRKQTQVRELGHWFRDSPLSVHAMHAPSFSDTVWGLTGPDSILSITERVKSKRLAVVDELKRALEVAESVPFRYWVQHLGSKGEEFDEYKVEAAFTVLEELMIFARQRGVEILLENTPNELASAERLLRFVDVTHLNLNFCLDLGHAHMHEGVETAYKLLRPRLRSVHVHDNDGASDQHLFPFQGTIDWGHAMACLNEAPGQYPLVLEVRDDEATAQPIDEALRRFDQLEAVGVPHES